MSALFPIISRLIQQGLEQQHKLSEFAGNIICISLTGSRLIGHIGEQSFLETANNAADTNITFYDNAIQEILQGGQPGVGDIDLGGDLVLGMPIPPILGGLCYYPGEDLTYVSSYVAAKSISSRVDDISRTIEKIGKNIARQVSNFLRGPESPVINQTAPAAWLGEVDELRDDIVRLNERLDRLERDIWID